MTMEPTGVIREVGAEDLFFSVTDRRGVIEQANATFARISAMTRDQLIGAPHNVVRHPMMPGGAFRLMWHQLLDGVPFVGYMHNLAADGARYDVLATVTPLPNGGFLSVRTRPLVEDSRELAWLLYQTTCEVEDHLRHAGLSRPEAAERGAEHLVGMMRDADLGSPEETMYDTLPAEVTALDARLGGLPHRPDATGLLRELADEVGAVFDGINTLMDRLEPISGLILGMRDASAVLRSAIDRSTTLASALAAHPVDDVAGPLAESQRRWTALGGEVDALMHVLMADMEDFRRVASKSRFLIALARLHTYMCGYFVAELIDDGPEAAEALPAMRALGDALAGGFEALERQVPVQRRSTAEAIRRIEGAARLLEAPADVMREWKELAGSADLPDPVRQLLPQVDVELSASAMAVQQLRSIAEKCTEAGLPDDLGDLRRRVTRIRALSADLAGSP